MHAIGLTQRRVDEYSHRFFKTIVLRQILVFQYIFWVHTCSQLLKDARLPDVRFHDLCHCVATFLLAAKIDLKVVSELLWHSSVAITADIYAHVLPEQQQEVVDKMGDMFKRS